jgi:hypothetical protein
LAASSTIGEAKAGARFGRLLRSPAAAIAADARA